MSSLTPRRANILRQTFASIVLSGLCVALASTGEDISAQEPKFKFAVEPKKAFEFGDTNKDGKLSRDEFDKLLAQSPRLKANEKLGNFLFNRLDANSDGSLTLAEYEKIADFAPKIDAPPGKFPFPKKDKDLAKKKEEPKPVVEVKATAEQIAFFEKKIRPILVKECYSCHSEESKKEKGGLLVDSRQALRKGGDTGPAVIPGDPKRSLLMQAIRQNGELKMPPKSKLSDDVVADFEKWIATGAADTREGHVAAAPKEIDIEAGRKFWAFQPPTKPAVPSPKNASWARNDLDRFVLAGLESKGLSPVRDADARSFVRRLYFDLTGLPPTPEAAEKFARDFANDPNGTIDRTVGELLATSQYGETWGRHWLDVSRFAESSGRAANQSYPHAWRYRDYVIGAFNADKPFDQFAREQLAGDLMSGGDEKTRAERTIATAFLALGPKAHNERNRRQFEADMVDEQIDATTQAFLGLTIACARCHDHKFDPIPQRDYYALAGIFQSTETCYGTARAIQNAHPSAIVELPKTSGLPAGQEPLTKARRETIEKQIADLRKEMQAAGALTPQAIRTRIQLTNLESQLAMFEADGTPKLLTMACRDKFRGADAPLLGRGEIDKPGTTVPRGLPQVLVSKQPTIGRGSGRKELAEWIGSKDNPLTARVYVNRVWHHLFGQGIVPTPDNFGNSGQRPSNQAMLDWLAHWFMNNGWSTKKLVHLLTTSHVYRLSTTYDERAHEVDPENVLLWRMSPRRLEAEKIRDAMMFVSGKLNNSPAKGSDVLRFGDGPAQGITRLRGMFAPEPTNRSIYMTILRDSLPESLTLFDFPDPSSVNGERAVTTVPAQALFLLNNPFAIAQAEATADRLLASGDSDAGRVRRAYEQFYSRLPSPQEEQAAVQFIASYSQRASKRAAWSAFAQALFASAEFSNLK